MIAMGGRGAADPGLLRFGGGVGPVSKLCALVECWAETQGIGGVIWHDSGGHDAEYWQILRAKADGWSKMPENSSLRKASGERSCLFSRQYAQKRCKAASVTAEHDQVRQGGIKRGKAEARASFVAMQIAADTAASSSVLFRALATPQYAGLPRMFTISVEVNPRLSVHAIAGSGILRDVQAIRSLPSRFELAASQVA